MLTNQKPYTLDFLKRRLLDQQKNIDLTRIVETSQLFNECVALVITTKSIENIREKFSRFVLIDDFFVCEQIGSLRSAIKLS